MPDEPSNETASTDPMIRLVPLSDIDAFVEVRAGSILDEAAVLAIQFLGGGDRNKSRAIFVQMAMEHFDSIGEAYDDKRFQTRMAAMLAARQAAREEAKRKEAEGAEKGPDTPPAPEPEKKD